MKTTTTTPASCVPKNWEDGTVWTGDNLHVMRGMNSESVDLIYLDPPFNSAVDYAAPIGSPAEGSEFKDTWNLTDIDEAWLKTIKEDMEPLWHVLMGVNHLHSSSMLSYLVYMVPRLVEMKRLLKPTGSIFLHCDPTASHYLKMVMDYIFGKASFRNEIVWHYSKWSNTATYFQRNHDIILFYSAGDSTFNVLRQLSDDKRKKIEKGYQVNRPGGVKQLIVYDEDKAAAKIAEGNYDKIVYRTSEDQGTPIPDTWTDINILNSQAKERTGYPTQKPLSLLERIIEASSNPGDVVLDPFAGCATTCIAAQKLGRNWVGIDISPKAVELINLRSRDELGLFDKAIARDDIPGRTDLGPAPKKSEAKKTLYGEQEGHCNGCEKHFEARHLEVDHIIPRANGGSDHLSNYQLLCGHCNRTKGKKSQAALKVRLAELGVGV